ncbi:MAG: DUF3536 domain-containing protein [Deltaproteobacteria bacterium]|nr:DUF3536 domain-containing protein [Deltaproteobacteria bacterium]
MSRYVCIHGHFYQPPRENPWLEAVEIEDSAEPFHDWNERIHSECYRANASARLLDGEGKIRAIQDNYRRLSFNLGPTLLSWMQRARPEDHDRIIAADAASRARFGGHGSAMAQAYNHLIMPLANRRDRLTQVRWGLADFRRRFGREAEGMWLPETAADTPSLEALAAEGLKFTVLAPHQAARIRPVGKSEWLEVSADTLPIGRPYLCKLPSGASIALFFYDGPTSRAVAFEGLLDDGRKFATRLIEVARHLPADAPLEHIATDGESYGHHHRFGDMALASALEHLEAAPDVELTNYAAFLAANPPTWEVELREETSWSCAHGIERWRADCGCHTGGDPSWNQAWRAPLRTSLDWLRDEVARRFEPVAVRLLKDPWAARDGWIDVVLDRRPETFRAFLEEHASTRLGPQQASDVACLMELQRHAMLMFTSCGWFFDDPSGIETRQVLRYASRVLQMAEEVLGPTLEPAFLSRLQEGRSNRPGVGSMASIYQHRVLPSRVRLADVAAHWSVSTLFATGEPPAQVYGYAVEAEAAHRRTLGEATLFYGRLKVRSTVTLRERQVDFGVIHFGDHNLSASVHDRLDDGAWRAFEVALVEAFEQGDLPGVVRLFDAHLGGTHHSLGSLFRDERRRVLGRVLENPLREASMALRQLYRSHAGLLRYLHGLEVPLPVPLQAAARWVLEADLAHALSHSPPDTAAGEEAAKAAAALDLGLDTDRLAPEARLAVDAALTDLRARPGDPEHLLALDGVLALCETVGLAPEVFEAQNLVCALAEAFGSRMLDEDEVARRWREAHAALAERLGIMPSLDPPPTTEGELARIESEPS